jgi:hypothetical protein
MQRSSQPPLEKARKYLQIKVKNTLCAAHRLLAAALLGIVAKEETKYH